MSENTDITIFQKENEVIKNNAFIRCRNKLTTLQRKSFAVLVHNTIEDIKEIGESKYYAMPLKEYRERMGHADSMPTKYIVKELEELMTKIIEWNLDDEGYGTRSVMLSAFEMEKGSGILKWAFSPFLVDKILEEGYTPLKLSVVLDFQSSYALALYENIQMRKSFKRTSFKLEEFRALMGVEKGEHPRMSNFKTFVLNPALEEINEKSDIQVYYKDQKVGAKIVGFTFEWKVLTNDEITAKNKRRLIVEAHREALKKRFGEKFKFDNKTYTLSKHGLSYRGKPCFDIAESYAIIKKLKDQGLI